jgi:rubrerythrin
MPAMVSLEPRGIFPRTGRTAVGIDSITRRQSTPQEDTMKLDEAIRTALDYENRIRDLYLAAADGTEDPTGKQIFRELAQDEQGHVDYLESRLQEWHRDGAISLEELAATVPSREAVRKAAAALDATLSKTDRGLRQQMLAKALEAEKDTSRFYRQMVDQLTGAEAEMFARFLEIEDAHIDIVQFEMDHLASRGFWYGFEEFDMEAG